MGLIGRVFQATNDEILSAARGWKLPPPFDPASRMVPIERKNPFTGQIQVLRTREPELRREEADEDAVYVPDVSHFAGEGLDRFSPTLLDTLGEALLGWPPDRCEASAGALSGPDGEVELVTIPVALVDALARVEALDEVATAWAEREGRRLALRGTTMPDMRDALAILVRQAREAKASQRGLHLWTCV